MDLDFRQFLILCLRGRRDEATAQEAGVLIRQNRIDWDAVLQLAQVEGVMPLLYTSLGGKELLPPAVEQALREAYLSTARRNMLLFHELGKALERLRAHEIPVIVLKGAALAEAVYQNIAVRPMIDLDLLVKRENAAAAMTVLAGLGYVPSHSAEWLLRSEVSLRKSAAIDVLLDLHWSLVDHPYYLHALPMRWFWETALPLRVEPAAAYMLGPEASVLHLCMHASLPGGADLSHLHDVAEVISFYQRQIGWEQVLARAAEYDMLLPLRYILSKVAWEWSAPVPAAVLERLQTMPVSAAEERVSLWHTAGHDFEAQRFLAAWVSLPGWKQKWYLTWGRLFPSLDFMRRRYQVRHSILLPLYYVYRWLVGLHSLLTLWSKRAARKG